MLGRKECDSRKEFRRIGLKNFSPAAEAFRIDLRAGKIYDAIVKVIKSEWLNLHSRMEKNGEFNARQHLAFAKMRYFKTERTPKEMFLGQFCVLRPKT